MATGLLKVGCVEFVSAIPALRTLPEGRCQQPPGLVSLRPYGSSSDPVVVTGNVHKMAALPHAHQFLRATSLRKVGSRL